MEIRKLKLFSHAKINFFLNVENARRNNGYHLIQTFMQKIDLCDSLNCSLAKAAPIILNDLNNKCDCPTENNIIFKAANILKQTFNIKSGAEISLEKNIPVCAGLGGGSANAATALISLVKLWGISISEDKLLELAAALGADVPFFIKADAALCEGFGEKVSPVPSKKYHLVLWNPNIPLSTAKVYNQFDKKLRPQKDVKNFLAAYSTANPKILAKEIWNNLAFAAEELMPELKSMKKECLENGALTAWVSGSGPTVISLCSDAVAADNFADKLIKNHPKHFIRVCYTLT